MPSTITSRHASFDIGSGMTKMVVAEVQNCKETSSVSKPKIKILHEHAVEIHLARDLERTGTAVLSEEVLTQAESVLSNMAEICQSRFMVPKENMIGFGTQVFRSAENGEQFLALISQKLGVRISVISQNQESAIGFATANALLPETVNKEDVICWDSGGASFQLSTASGKTLEGRLGSAIVCGMISKIKGIPVTESPNPVSENEVHQLDENIMNYMLENFAELENFWSKKWKCPNRRVVGISGKTCIFATCMHALNSKLNPDLQLRGKLTPNPHMSFEEVEKIRAILIGRKDEEFRELGFMQVQMIIPKLALLRAVMKFFNINTVEYVPSTGGCIGFLSLKLKTQIQ